MRFATVSAHDLEDTAYTLPDDLPGTWRIVLMPFKRWQQIQVNAWVDTLEPLTSRHHDLTVWEVPTLSRLWAPARGYIDGGMRAGIPDRDTRLHTLTAYTSLEQLAAALDIPGYDETQVFLLDAAGEIVWRGSGEPDAEKARTLAEALSLAGGMPDEGRRAYASWRQPFTVKALGQMSDSTQAPQIGRFAVHTLRPRSMNR
jgi:hypothetical protein